jgi:hypothetical protein
MKSIQSEKRRYAARLEQLYGAHCFTADDGNARGARVFHVHTAGGLELDVLLDIGLDVGQVRFRGVNMAFLSKSGQDGGTRNLPYEQEFLHTYPGGLVYTCGLRSVGPTNRDGGEWQSMHGRIHGQGAEHAAAYVEDGHIILRSALHESALFGHCLRLSRIIKIPAYGSALTISDTIENLTRNPQEYMLLYHCNFGYPFLDDALRLLLPEGTKITPPPNGGRAARLGEAFGIRRAHRQ